MIFKAYKYQLGCWQAEKKIECADEEKITHFVDYMIPILKKLEADDLFVPKECDASGGSHVLTNEHIYDRQFWLDALYSDQTKFYHCLFKGDTLFYEDNQTYYQHNALKINMNLDTSIDNQTTLTLDIKVKADNFASNFIINRVEPNPDYERNHGRLHQFLKWLINQGFDVSPYHDTATLVDLEIHSYVQDYEIFMYTEWGYLDDWFSIYDMDFRGKLYNIKDQLP